MFDPRLVPTLPSTVDKYAAVGLPQTTDMKQELFQYRATATREAKDHKANEEFLVPEYWKGAADRFPQIAKAAEVFIWFPVGSVDVERSFSVYKQVVTDKWERLTEEHTKQLVSMNFNGDVVGRWDGFTY